MLIKTWIFVIWIHVAAAELLIKQELKNKPPVEPVQVFAVSPIDVA